MHPINKKLANSISNFQSLKLLFMKKRRNLIERLTEIFLFSSDPIEKKYFFVFVAREFMKFINIDDI